MHVLTNQNCTPEFWLIEYNRRVNEASTQLATIAGSVTEFVSIRGKTYAPAEAKRLYERWRNRNMRAAVLMQLAIDCREAGYPPTSLDAKAIHLAHAKWRSAAKSKAA